MVPDGANANVEVMNPVGEMFDIWQCLAIARMCELDGDVGEYELGEVGDIDECGISALGRWMWVG